MKIAAYVVAVFWLVTGLFALFYVSSVSGEGGRYVLSMVTISIYAAALLQRKT